MINRMYQLYELKDQIPQAIENANKLKEKETALIEMVKDAGKYNEFDFMIKPLEEECKNLDIQIGKFTTRLELLNLLIADYEKQDEHSEIIADTVSKLLESIGAIQDPIESETSAE